MQAPWHASRICQDIICSSRRSIHLVKCECRLTLASPGTSQHFPSLQERTPLQPASWDQCPGALAETLARGRGGAVPSAMLQERTQPSARTTQPAVPTATRNSAGPSRAGRATRRSVSAVCPAYPVAAAMTAGGRPRRAAAAIRTPGLQVARRRAADPHRRSEVISCKPHLPPERL